MKKSFKLLKQSEVSDTFTGVLFRWIFYALAFAVLLWPALFVIVIVIAAICAILALLFVLSIIALPAAIVARLLRLV